MIIFIGKKEINIIIIVLLEVKIGILKLQILNFMEFFHLHEIIKNVHLQFFQVDL